MIIQPLVGLGKHPHVDEQEEIFDAHDDHVVSTFITPLNNAKSLVDTT